MIQPERVQPLNRRPRQTGHYVLYWMQAAQRVTCNHALEYAIRQANEADRPVVVVFGLTDDYPGANGRHYAFLLAGLQETAATLAERGMRLVVRRESPAAAALALAGDAREIVTDVGYLRLQRQWRRQVAREAPCAVTQVETNVVAPLAAVSTKEQYAAATYRPKVQRVLKRYLRPLAETPVRRRWLGWEGDSFDIGDTEAVLNALKIDRSVPPVADYVGGTTAATRRLTGFIKDRLQHYETWRNDPNRDGQSDMSPYLHFGQIAPLAIALAVGRRAGAEAYLEELIVRRELAMNFVRYNDCYDTFGSIRGWNRQTLQAHRRDERSYVYTREQLETAQTHDPYWNAAQRQMIRTGKMHGYLRMYWGKKILEWCRTPQYAYRVAVDLNDKYELDGRDPNGYAGVAWCFGKHDRPWAERPVFGTVRYMNDAGLRRKFDADAYAARWSGD